MNNISPVGPPTNARALTSLIRCTGYPGAAGQGSPGHTEPGQLFAQQQIRDQGQDGCAEWGADRLFQGCANPPCIFTPSSLTPPPPPAGKSAIKALLAPAYAKVKNVPKCESEEDAQKLLASVMPFAFFLRVDRGQPSGSSSNSPKHLQINQMQLFQPAEYYAWFYEGSQWMTTVGGVAMLAVMLAGVMFPLWPPIMRLGVWYLSIGVLGLIGLFIIIAILRLIFYIITVIVASPGIWIFPKLFADVGFVSGSFGRACAGGG